MSNTTLEAIRTKVRRITRAPSQAKITDAELDEYINTYISYDIPESLRLFALKSTLTFFVDPYIDTYETNSIVGDGLNDFKNNYITVNPPVYIGGSKANFYQSRDVFFNSNSLNNAIVKIGSGDGANTTFTGTLQSKPVLRNEVTFTSIDAANNGLRVYDDGSGNIIGDIGAGANTIDYVTGVYNLTFSSPPGNGKDVDSQTVPYTPGKPSSVLYFDNKFTFRPVPDKPYRVNIEVFKKPTELLNAGDSPFLNEWWQMIALGAAVKIFEDRMDIESSTALRPVLIEQERFAQRRTLVQKSNEQVATIYNSPNYNKYGGWIFYGN